MKFVQVIDGAQNCVYDIFAVNDDDFDLIFPEGTDIAFAEDFVAAGNGDQIQGALARLWKRRIPKVEAAGIHGVIFFGLEFKRQYYPTLRDEEAENPDGTQIRADDQGRA